MTSHDGNVITAAAASESVSGGPATKMEPQVQSGHEALYGSWHPMAAAGGALCNQYLDHERSQVDHLGESSAPAAYDVMKEKYKNCDLPQARATHEFANSAQQQHQNPYAHQAAAAATAFDGSLSRAAAVPTKLDVRVPADVKEQSQSQMSMSFPVPNENYSQHDHHHHHHHHLPQQSTSDSAYHGNGDGGGDGRAAENSAAAAAAAAAAFAAAQHQMQQFDVMQNCYAAASMQYHHQQQGQHQQGKGIYAWMKPYGTGKSLRGVPITIAISADN